MGELGYHQPQIGERYSGKASSSQVLAPKALSYEETYRCPACASGELNAIALMDIFACDFCRHMFLANLENQSVHLADSLQPMAWQWNGWRWQTAQQSDTAAGVIWAFTIGLVLAPVGIIALSSYVFPPLDSTDFPRMWTALTLGSHSTIALWLLAEYYRWPWYISSRIRLNRLKARLFGSDDA
ncbi:MAG: hypothetical protein WA947_02850 [Phormidesmis sp.]